MGRVSPQIFATLAILASVGIASPASAQSARDFTLPPSQPAEEPEVQGAADESGLVPIGPRLIPEENTAQQPEADPVADDQPAPREQTPPPDTAGKEPASMPATAVTVAPVTRVPKPSPPIRTSPEINTSPPSPEIGLETETQSDPITFPPPIAAETPLAPAGEGPTDPQWLWYALGGLALALSMSAGWFKWQRRRTRHVPQIKRPIPAANARQDYERARVDIDVEVVGLSRSLMTLTLNCRITAANRSARAVRDIGISADLTCAHRSLPVEQQLALPDTYLPQCAMLDRIGPHQSHHQQLSLQIPVTQLSAFKHGQAALCVPLLRLRINAPSIEDQAYTYMVGIAEGDAAARLQPVPLHVPPGSYPSARARLLN